jgi:hypothetical protein
MEISKETEAEEPRVGFVQRSGDIIQCKSFDVGNGPHEAIDQGYGFSG